MLTLNELERRAYVEGADTSLFELALLGEAAMVCAPGDIEAGFPREGCLSDEIDELARIVKSMRHSVAKVDLQLLVENLTARQGGLVSNGDYGADLLRKFRESIRP